MKDTHIGNFLTYEGKVDIFTTLRNGKQIHLTTFNEGKQAISELFTRACLGYSLQDYIPRKLDITTTGGTSILYAPVDLRAASYQTVLDAQAPNNGWKYPTFDALILTDDISVELSSEVTEYYFKLLANNNVELAQISVNIQKTDNVGNNANTLYVRSGNSILVRWSLFLTNMPAQEGE